MIQCDKILLIFSVYNNVNFSHGIKITQKYFTKYEINPKKTNCQWLLKAVRNWFRQKELYISGPRGRATWGRHSSYSRHEARRCSQDGPPRPLDVRRRLYVLQRLQRLQRRHRRRQDVLLRGRRLLLVPVQGPAVVQANPRLGVVELFVGNAFSYVGRPLSRCLK